MEAQDRNPLQNSCMPPKDNLNNLDYRVRHAFPQSRYRDNLLLSSSPQESGMCEFKPVSDYNSNMLPGHRKLTFGLVMGEHGSSLSDVCFSRFYCSNLVVYFKLLNLYPDAL